MAHLNEELQDAARGAIEAMKGAALAARALHARAELFGHMKATAAKVKARPRDEAVAFVVQEWMKAWGLDRAAYSGLASPMLAFTAAICRYVDHPGDEEDAGVREAAASLEAAFEAHGTTLADEMAWRSECAHGWWQLVRPPPPQLPKRPSVPAPAADQAFWEAGCARHCRP